MTELLERAVTLSRSLPDDRQNEIAELMLAVLAEQAEEPFRLTAEEMASFEESLAQADRGEFAPEAEVRAIWAKHGL